MSIFKPNLNSNSFPSKKRKFLASKYDDMYIDQLYQISININKTKF